MEKTQRVAGCKSAHVLPALLELSEQANNHLLQLQEIRIYQS